MLVTGRLVIERLVKTAFFPYGALVDVCPDNGGSWAILRAAKPFLECLSVATLRRFSHHSGFGIHALVLFALQFQGKSRNRYFTGQLVTLTPKIITFIDSGLLCAVARDLYGEIQQKLQQQIGIRQRWNLEEVIQEKNQISKTHTGDEFLLSYDTQLFGTENCPFTADG
jgi:hypothetical protein